LARLYTPGYNIT